MTRRTTAQQDLCRFLARASYRSTWPDHSDRPRNQSVCHRAPQRSAGRNNAADRHHRDGLVAVQLHDELALHPRRSLDPLRGWAAVRIFFPVERSSLEAIRPEFRSLASDPQLAEDFATWDQSRRAFQQAVADDPPADPAAKWQKRYYRGQYPEDERRAADHQSKLRLAPFANGPMLAVPTSRTPPPSVPAPKSSALTQLHRRDWLLKVQEAQRNLMPDGGGLLSVSPPTRDEFLSEFYGPSRPALFSDMAAGWPALTRWTPALPTERLGGLDVEVQAGRTANTGYEREKDRHLARMLFRDFLSQCEHASNDVYLTAYNSGANASLRVALASDVGRLDEYLAYNRNDLLGMPWIGGAGTFTPLHHNLTNNLLVQIVGRKQIVLLPPSETCKLAAVEGVFSDVVDLDDPACIARHPEATSAQGYRLTLEPGDGLFIPVGWWHQVRSLEFAISLTYTNFHWPNDASQSWPG